MQDPAAQSSASPSNFLLISYSYLSTHSPFQLSSSWTTSPKEQFQMQPSSHHSAPRDHGRAPRSAGLPDPNPGSITLCPHPKHPAKLPPLQRVADLGPRRGPAPEGPAPAQTGARGPTRPGSRGGSERAPQPDSRRKERERRRAAARPLLPEAMVAAAGAATRAAVIRQ